MFILGLKMSLKLPKLVFNEHYVKWINNISTVGPQLKVIPKSRDGKVTVKVVSSRNHLQASDMIQ